MSMMDSDRKAKALAKLSYRSASNDPEKPEGEQWHEIEAERVRPKKPVEQQSLGGEVLDLIGNGLYGALDYIAGGSGPKNPVIDSKPAKRRSAGNSPW